MYRENQATTQQMRRNSLGKGNQNPPSRSTSTPWTKPWQAEELETVTACPVCGNVERSVLHEGLIDNVFFVAPGKWTLKSCIHCSSAYLDPRPTKSSIGKAYGNYYTHTAGTTRSHAATLGLFRRLRRMISNDYLNYRYGTQRKPAFIFGRLIAKFLPDQRQKLDTEFRYLPKPTEGQRLLDIGCGNGSFLVRAQEAGWQVAGVEPDFKAADVARQRGLNVTTGTIDTLANESNCFDAITLSHVIEHVHEPAHLLLAVQRLLKPGGIVFIDTPNIQSHGAAVFKSNWRGLEAPRHLVLFNRTSLVELLADIDFTRIKSLRRTTVWKGTFKNSLLIEAGYSPYGLEIIKLGWFHRIRMSLLFTATNNLEFITLTARKRSA